MRFSRQFKLTHYPAFGQGTDLGTSRGTVTDTTGGVYSFLYLNPNITQGANDGEFKFIGARSYGANFSLHGQRSNGGLFGSPTASEPSVEAVRITF